MSNSKNTEEVSPSVLVTALPKYIPEQSDPERPVFFFSYKIRIQNQSPIAVQLLSRHWVITDGLGRVDEVKGPGVIGQQPWIAAGDSFEYESFCPLTTPTGTMSGQFHMVSAHGKQFSTAIPEFFLIEPNSFH